MKATRPDLQAHLQTVFESAESERWRLMQITVATRTQSFQYGREFDPLQDLNGGA